MRVVCPDPCVKDPHLDLGTLESLLPQALSPQERGHPVLCIEQAAPGTTSHPGKGGIADQLLTAQTQAGLCLNPAAHQHSVASAPSVVMLSHLQRAREACSIDVKQCNLCHSCLELQELRLAQASIMSAYRPGRLCTSKSWLLLNHCEFPSCSWSASLARDLVTLNSGWMSLTLGSDTMLACRSMKSSSWLHLLQLAAHSCRVGPLAACQGLLSLQWCWGSQSQP